VGFDAFTTATERCAMAWNGHWYSFDREAILRFAPTGSGVYGLANETWIYAGESNGIQLRLLEHLAGDNACITGNAPTQFSWELWLQKQRFARQNEVIVEFSPTCNQRAG
jgi:hypothetical protein